MRKYIIIMILMLFFNTSILANDVEKIKNINNIEKVDSILDFDYELKEVEYTFQDHKTISGYADEKTDLYIYVYQENDDGIDIIDVYNYEVGAFNKFSYFIDLKDKVGEFNFLIHAINGEKKDVKKFKVVIKDKSIIEKIKNMRNIFDNPFNIGEMLKYEK